MKQTLKRNSQILKNLKKQGCCLGTQKKKSTFAAKVRCAHTAVVPHDNPRAKPMSTGNPRSIGIAIKGKISIKTLN